MEFDSFLIAKKIDPEKFRIAESNQYIEWKQIFDQVHPDSFTQQKLFLINKVRRAYQLKEAPVEKKESPTPVRPKMKPIKLKPKTK